MKFPNFARAPSVLIDTYKGYRYVSLKRFAAISEYTLPVLTPNDIKEKLERSKIPFITGHTCFRLKECSMCAPYKTKTKSSRSTEVYVNKQTGYFVCEMCKSGGSWEVFDRLLTGSLREGQKTVKQITLLREGCLSFYEKGQQAWRKIVEENVLLHKLPDEEYEEVFRRFQLSFCPKSVCEKLDIYINREVSTMFLPMYSATQLVLGYITIDSSNNCKVTPKRDCAGFLQLLNKRKNNSAVIVSNISDFFALASSNISPNIICLPYGVTNLPQTMLPFLESFESLILWFGLVPGALDATRNFAKKLNEQRCSVIRATNLHVSPTVALSNGENISKILSEAQPTWHQAITTFSSLRKDVLQELRNHDVVLGVKWQRFPSLNKTLRGHRRGELTVLTGPTGSGKTTFMSEYSLDLACQGVNTLWGSFEVRNVRLARTMLQQYVGQPLEDNLNIYDTFADDFQQLPIYFLTFHGQQSIRTVMDVVQHAAYIHDIAHVIIDNVQFMIGMSEDSKYMDRFHKQDLIIHAFRQFATRSNVHVTLVIHPRKERESEDLTASSIFGGAKAAQEADNVLIIQDKRLTSIKGKKYLQVTKNRYTGDLGIMILEFDKKSLSFSKRKKQNEDNSKLSDPAMKIAVDATRS